MSFESPFPKVFLIPLKKSSEDKPAPAFPKDAMKTKRYA
jgi:hypothetical protein